MSARIAAIAAVVLGLGLGACSGDKEAQREESATREVAQPTQPKVGLVTDVDSRRLLLDSAEDPGDEAELFERTRDRS